MMTYYDVLAIAPDATPKQIKQAYRAAVQVTHPDRLQQVSWAARAYAEEQLKRINEAYGVLNTPERCAAMIQPNIMPTQCTKRLVQGLILLHSAPPHIRTVQQRMQPRQMDHATAGRIHLNHHLLSGMRRHGQGFFSSKGSAESGSGSQAW